MGVRCIDKPLVTSQTAQNMLKHPLYEKHCSKGTKETSENLSSATPFSFFFHLVVVFLLPLHQDHAEGVSAPHQQGSGPKSL